MGLHGGKPALQGLRRGDFGKGYASEIRARQAILDNYPPLPWDLPTLDRCGRVEAFLQDLTVTQGSESGSKLKLEGFQRKFLRAVYKEEFPGGPRPIRTAIMSLARKNGKTSLAAGMALCHLCGPEAESRGEVYSCANDRTQAGKIFFEMLAMINAHDYLRARCNVLHYHKHIYDLETSSTYMALSREAKTKFGLSPSFCIYDEYGQADGDELYRAMDSAMGARKEPLMMVISTQAADDNAPLSRLIDYGKQIKAGAIRDKSFHLTLYAADDADDPWAPETWKKANPALGKFRSLEDVERQALQARNMPSQENSFRNLFLNLRVSAHTKLIAPAVWKACGQPPNIPDGVRVYAALDLGATSDMTALVVIFQDLDGVFHVKPWFWLAGDLVARSNEDRVPYATWAKEGLLTPAGDTTDPEMVALKIAELNGRYRIQTLAYDRWRINDLRRELDKIGCRVQLVEHGQGYRDMSPAVDIFERMIQHRRIRHGNHKILTANVANAVVVRDPAGNRKLDKSRSQGKIDGLVALCMAFSVAMIKVEKKVDIRTLIA